MWRHSKPGTNSPPRSRSCWSPTVRHVPRSSAKRCPRAPTSRSPPASTPAAADRCPRVCARHGTGRSSSRPSCRSTRTGTSPTRATSRASTPTACAPPTDCCAEAGLSLDHAVTTYDYSTPATRRAYPLCAGPRRELLGGAGVFPGAGGILMSRLHAPGVLVALDVTASRHPLTAVNPGWRRYDTLTYSPGVRAGRTLHMSGFAALDMDTQQALHAGDPAAQTHAIYRAVRTVIEAAGGGPEDLVHTQEFLCPTALAPTARADAASPAGTTATSADPWAEARAGALGPGARPAVTTAGCAALLRREFLIEVFPTAVLPASALAPGDLPEGGR